MSYLLASLAAFSGIKWCFALTTYKKKPTNAKFVGTVSGIFLYPVKSCQAISLKTAYCAHAGFKHTDLKELFDRHYMVVDEGGNFLSQRKLPTMTLISPTVTDENLQLDAPGMPTFKVKRTSKIENNKIFNCKVWGENVQGLDCGKEAADWLQKYLQVPCKLVFAAPHLQKRNLCEIPDCDVWHKMTKPEDRVAYPDFAPYLLISDASVHDLNQRLEKPVEMKRFRPNITVEGCSEPYTEDNWKYVYIGSSKFDSFKPCGRCKMTTVDPKTGTLDASGEPLKTMKKYRKKPTHGSDPCFGMNLLIEFQGNISVGDPVYVVSNIEA